MDDAPISTSAVCAKLADLMAGFCADVDEDSRSDAESALEQLKIWLSQNRTTNCLDANELLSALAESGATLPQERR